MKKDYVSDVKSNVENRVYVTGYGINVLIPSSHIEEFKKKGYVVGYTKPYTIEVKEEHDEL